MRTEQPAKCFEPFLEIIIMSLFNEDNIFSKYTNLKYGHLKINIHINHIYIHIYKSKMSGRPNQCMRKYYK